MKVAVKLQKEGEKVEKLVSKVVSSREKNAQNEEIRSLKALETLFRRPSTEKKMPGSFSQKYEGLKESIIRVDTEKGTVRHVHKVKRLKEVLRQIAFLDIKINDYAELLKIAKKGKGGSELGKELIVRLNAWNKERDDLTEYVFELVGGKKEDGQVPLGVAIRELCAWRQKLPAKNSLGKAAIEEIGLLLERIKAELYLQIWKELGKKKAKTADEEAYLLNLRLIFDPDMNRKVKVTDELCTVVDKLNKDLDETIKEFDKTGEKTFAARKKKSDVESVEIKQDKKLLEEMDDGTSTYKRLRNLVDALEEELEGKKRQ